MSLIAVLPDGRREAVDARYGDSIQGLVRSLTADSLTGSAVPLAGAHITLASGETVTYSAVVRFEQEDSFL